MDLRLGLSLEVEALSGSSPSTSSDNISIDLNVEDDNDNDHDDDQDQKMEILGSVKKRCFDEAFDESINSDHQNPSPQTLPLLLRWNNNNNDDDDNLEQEIDIDVIINEEEYLETENSSSVVEYYGGGGVVGWPPTNSWRRRRRRKTDTTGNQSGVGVAAVENRGGLINGHYRRKNNSVMFVKVKMEGVGIARKFDLLLHHSSHTLLQTLLTMFGKCQESIDDYKLLFQDKEGFWHSSEDVPWGNLIQSVNRLQLLRKRY